MNRRQTLVQEQFLDREEVILKRLNSVYTQSLKDINAKVKDLEFDIKGLKEKYDWMDDDDPEKVNMKSRIQSKIYQKQYQEQLQKQVDGILNQLHEKQYTNISDYLNECYSDGFVGTIFDMHGQGVPLMMPIDQEAMIRAVQTDSKISNGLYARLGEDVNLLKKKITAQVSRSISTGMTFAQTAQQLAGYTKIGMNNASRIVRTEGHRIQCTAAMDACHQAKERGADVVKQWDSALDARTRDSHVRLDGEIKELDEKFSNGLMFPGDPSGGAAEVVNCRCALLQRARWALDKDELQTLKDRAAYFGLDKTEQFDDFKKKYLKSTAQTVQNVPKSQFVPAKTIKEAEEYAKIQGIKYTDYSKLPIDMANEVNKALETLPDDVRPVFVGDSSALEKYWGGKLPRSSKQYYGVTIDTFDGVHLGVGKGIDFDTSGQMVGISYSYRTADKITVAKEAAQARYQAKHNGHTWFFNVSGETTPYHEMGHVYANAKGLPDGFEYAAKKWANEAKCDMISKPTEAWAEAWASYHTGVNVDKVPGYILDYIKKVAK